MAKRQTDREQRRQREATPQAIEGSTPRARSMVEQMVEKTGDAAVVVGRDRPLDVLTEGDRSLSRMKAAWEGFVNAKHDLSEATDAVMDAFERSPVMMADIVQRKKEAAEVIRALLRKIDDDKGARIAAGQLMRV